MARLILGTIADSEIFPPFGRHFPILSPRNFQIEGSDLLSHKHVIGRVGQGKSKLLQWMWLSYFRQGMGTTLIDPHGHTAEGLLEILAQDGFFERPNAFNRVLYVEFKNGQYEHDTNEYINAEYYFPLNLFDIPYVSKDEVIPILRESFHRAWPELQQGSALFDEVFFYSCKIAWHNDVPLPAVARLLKMNAKERSAKHVTFPDKATEAFFLKQWDHVNENDQFTYAGSAPRRFERLAEPGVMSNCLSLDHNGLNFLSIMNTRTAVIVNLGGIKDKDTLSFFGSFILHGFEVAAQSRFPRIDLPPHQLIVDEFPVFMEKSKDSLDMILTRARAAGLFLTMAHQNWSQAEALQGALGNALVKISFQLEHNDALLESQLMFDPDSKAIRFDAPTETTNPVAMPTWEQFQDASTRIENLPPRHMIVKLPRQEPKQVITPDLPDPIVDPLKIEGIKHRYYQKHYVHRDSISRLWEEPDEPNDR